MLALNPSHLRQQDPLQSFHQEHPHANTRPQTKPIVHILWRNRGQDHHRKPHKRVAAVSKSIKPSHISTRHGEQHPLEKNSFQKPGPEPIRETWLHHHWNENKELARVNLLAGETQRETSKHHVARKCHQRNVEVRGIDIAPGRFVGHATRNLLSYSRPVALRLKNKGSFSLFFFEKKIRTLWRNGHRMTLSLLNTYCSVTSK